MESDVSCFTVGDKFATFLELEEKIHKYQKDQFVQFYKRDSRKIEAARKRATNKNYKEEIVYSELVFSCIHGGKKFKSKSDGKRPKQRTFRKGCQAEIKLRASEDGSHLVVTSVNTDHNHELKKVEFAHLPQQRRLDDDRRQKVSDMLALKVNKKLLQQHMMVETGQVVILKDIHNISALSSNSDRNKDLEQAVKALKKAEGAVVEVTVNSENVLSGIYFQDGLMKEIYQQYPEILFVDATHKLNELRMPLYVLLVEDGNGESHIVAVWLVTSEDAATTKAMAEIFQAHNEQWHNTVTIMADKDFTERNIFQQQFPQANLLVCSFHVLKTFRREITSEKIGITAAERYTVLEILQRTAYSTTEEMYMKCYEELKATKLTKVIEYFDDNWHDIRREWGGGLRDESLTYQNRTNNRVESINQKLKSVISKFARLPQFCTELVGVLSMLRTERDHRAISLFQKVPVQPFSPDSIEHHYMELLTPFALSFVLRQISLADKVKIKCEMEDSFEIESSTQCKVTATCFECNCSFRKTMQLPCRHIFAIRRRCELSLFDPKLCAVRWTLQYYRSSNRVLYSSDSSHCEDAGSSLDVSVVEPVTKPILSQQEKYRKAFHITQKLASLAAEAPMREFDEKLKCLENILSIWECGGNFNVDEYCDEDEVVDGKNDVVNPEGSIEDLSFASVESKSDTESLPLLLEEKPVPENTIDVQSDRHPKVQNVEMSDIRLPGRVPKRGRPKGSDLTVIGLPKKKKLAEGPVAFLRQHPKDQERGMLKWFVSVRDANMAMNDGALLDEASVQVRHEKIPNACIDENVNLFRIRKHFTDDGWAQLCQVVEKKKYDPSYYCQVCERELLECTAICCDCCLEWLHLSCAGLKSTPKRKEWFCHLCKMSHSNETKSCSENTTPQVIPKTHNASCVTFQSGTAANRLRERRAKEREEKTVGAEHHITLSSDDEHEDEEPDKIVIEIAAGVKVYESDLKILQNPIGWLNARLMNAGQTLLKRKFQNVAGLQDVGRSQTCTFENKSEFVQVLNCYESHWILVSKKNCKINQVNIYDSSCTGDVPISTKEVVASLVNTPGKHLSLTFPDVQQQTGGSDCGLFVLAFAYTLCNGVAPEKMTYIQSELRSHFLCCLTRKEMSSFPADTIMRVPAKPLLKTFRVYCSCRLPDIGDGMVKCHQCLERFHRSCIQADKDTLPSKWYCSACIQENDSTN